jgi:hypothetical protein
MNSNARPACDVDMDEFWDGLNKDLLLQRYNIPLSSSCCHYTGKAFDYQSIAFWIGKQTRRSSKVHKTARPEWDPNAWHGGRPDKLLECMSSEYAPQLTVETLTTMRLDDHNGAARLLSKKDLVKWATHAKVKGAKGMSCQQLIHLITKMMPEEAECCAKIFHRNFGWTGGTCDVVSPDCTSYGLSFSIGAEAAHDLVDLTGAMDQMPNILCSDIACRQVTAVKESLSHRIQLDEREGALMMPGEDKETESTKGE